MNSWKWFCTYWTVLSRPIHSTLISCSTTQTVLLRTLVTSQIFLFFLCDRHAALQLYKKKLRRTEKVDIKWKLFFIYFSNFNNFVAVNMFWLDLYCLGSVWSCRSCNSVVKLVLTLLAFNNLWTFYGTKSDYDML